MWLKRDLRIRDHAPFFHAEKSSLPYLILYLFEPDMISRADTALRHLQFCYHSIRAMNEELAFFNKRVEICYGKATDVFEELIRTFDLNEVFSHRESGVLQSWERDKSVAKLLSRNQIKWSEFQRDGILRGIKNRDQWTRRWREYMSSPLIVNQFDLRETPVWNHPFELSHKLEEKLQYYPSCFQPAGTRAAEAYMESFFNGRAENYMRHISKPTNSRRSCSRLSPYLAWGNLSIRQVVQKSFSLENEVRNKFSLQNFRSRLQWHCHFIQKFEQACSYESKCINRGFELLSYENDDQKLSAWMDGRTGIPLVDASMRCLRETAWVNFRMRAMLVSFLCHHLDQDWRRGTAHLANLFLDFDPGIHYPQFQMQAGTTGTNIIRIYNPVKNGLEHDPNGAFVKKWLPELVRLPEDKIHEPWTLTPIEQLSLGFEIGRDYPNPIVDPQQAAAMAREKMWKHQKHPVVIREAGKIVNRLTNRKKRLQSGAE